MLVYYLLILIPTCFSSIQTGSVYIGRDTAISDAAFASASSMLTPDGLRNLMSYSPTSSAPSYWFGQYFSLATVLYTYTLVVYFSVRIWLRLRASMALLSADARLREVNRQMNRVLATQALAPLVFAIGPPLFINVLGVAGGLGTIDFGTQASMSLLLSLQPVANGLLTTMLVRPYRQAVFTLMCGRKETPAVPIPVGSAPSSTMVTGRHL